MPLAGSADTPPCARACLRPTIRSAARFAHCARQHIPCVVDGKWSAEACIIRIAMRSVKSKNYSEHTSHPSCHTDCMRTTPHAKMPTRQHTHMRMRTHSRTHATTMPAYAHTHAATMPAYAPTHARICTAGGRQGDCAPPRIPQPVQHGERRRTEDPGAVPLPRPRQTCVPCLCW